MSLFSQMKLKEIKHVIDMRDAVYCMRCFDTFRVEAKVLKVFVENCTDVSVILGDVPARIRALGSALWRGPGVEQKRTRNTRQGLVLMY